MAIAIRTRIMLSINLPNLFWKLLCKEQVDLRDFIQVDHLMVHNIILPLKNPTLTMEQFDDIVRDSEFLHSLAPSLPSPRFENRENFVNGLEEYYLHRCDLQLKSIRFGFSEIIPQGLLSAISSEQLELLVCGTNDIDIELLKRHTEYSGCEENSAHIQNFWKVLLEFSPEQRCKFVEFAYGQSRLPSTDEEFTAYPRIRMLIKCKESSNPDALLPRADT
jgi:hypothetical protein